MHLGTGWEMCPNHMPASRLGGGGACRRRAFLFKPHERSVELLGTCEQPVGIEGARLHEPQGTQKVLAEGEASKHPGAQLSVPACSSEGACSCHPRSLARKSEPEWLRASATSKRKSQIAVRN
jgi:hypothetical protein